jgi:nicotinamidase-related amidase
VTADTLFDALDVDGDGRLSRDDLAAASVRLRWRWPEAPLLAVLDAMTVARPLSRAQFHEIVDQVTGDPHGLYGEVLRRIVPVVGPPLRRSRTVQPMSVRGGFHEPSPLQAQILETVPDIRASRACRPPESALLIIDPQRSFTAGAWMQSIGPGGEHDVEPIRHAFAACGRALARLPAEVATIFTRCPFPPGSYDWDDRVAAVLDPAQPYLIKPGNSVLRPATNGFREWIDGLLAAGRRTLVMGGCTLNSCVRVSATEVQRAFGDRGFQVVVDLGLAGARASNYRPSPLFEDRSPVEAAIHEMASAGVGVVAEVRWT